MRYLLLLFAVAVVSPQISFAAELQVAPFVANVTPPVGSPLAYDPMREIETPLTARGVVLLGSGKPIVLCSVDWIGIANGGRTAWRTELAEAAGTSMDRVALHAVHQHDAPECDFTVETLLAEQGQGGSVSTTPSPAGRSAAWRKLSKKQSSRRRMSRTSASAKAK